MAERTPHVEGTLQGAEGSPHDATVHNDRWHALHAVVIASVARALGEADDVRELLRSTIEILARHARWPAAAAVLLGDVPSAGADRRIEWGTSAEAIATLAALADSEPHLDLTLGAAPWVIDTVAGQSRMVSVPLDHGKEPVAVLQFLAPPGEAVQPETVLLLQEAAEVAGPIAGHRVLEERLQASAHRNAEFVARAAHELRAPVAALALLAETLALHIDRLSPERLASTLDAAAQVAVRLRRLVRDVLDLSRLEASAELAPAETFRVADIVAALAWSAPAPAGVRVRASVPDALTALGSRSRTEQVMVNLLMNAYAYGGPNIRIEAAHTGPCTTIVVSDDGPGVPATVEHTLFDPFVRGHSETDGSGLGLAIARQLVCTMGGTIEYRRDDSGGARFVVQLRRSRC